MGDLAGSVYTQQGALPALGRSSISPGQSSPEPFEVEDEHNSTQSTHWNLSDQTSPTSSIQPPRAGAPLQKRRRVTRACDECRRKKIKCDGKQPCTHCTVYSYDCTYDQPSNRRRNPAPHYIEALEVRLRRAETLLRTVLPNVDLNDPNLDNIALQQTSISNAKDAAQENPTLKSEDAVDGPGKEAQLRSMIESTGQLDLDESGHWDFHGRSSGTVWVKRMREQLGGLLGAEQSGALFPRVPRQPLNATFSDSPRSALDSPMDSNLPITVDLPSKECARALCECSLDRACCLLRFVHQPTFYELFDRVYDVPVENFGDEENRYIPLLYMVLALGCMFNHGSDVNQDGYKNGIEHGIKYFKAARHLMDITDCRDITSLQAILFMILFLQSSANLSTCYSYIGIALRSALRMGLHRSFSGTFNFIERETRRRVFWIIRKMDTYVSALLGFPQMLSYDDIDQELPIEVDDEYITKEAILKMPNGEISLLYAAANAHTRLMGTLAKVIKYIYPTKGLEKSVQGTQTASYLISHAKIREIERDLADWLDKLPMGLRPGGDGTEKVLRVQQLLRLAYAHVQMMLYRPFLHYVSGKGAKCKTIDERSYACAAACVSVSRNVVHITAEMKKRGLLIGAYWFTMYTTFFAILSLVFFVIENPEKSGSQEILSDANDGKAALNDLAQKSQAADRCSIALQALFEKLPLTLDNGKQPTATTKKKRSAPDSAQSGQRVRRGSHDNAQSSSPLGMGPRATTFPVPAHIQTSNLPKTSLDGNRFQSNTMSNPNLRQSFHEIYSPADLSSAGTPSSGITNSGMQEPQYSMQQQFGTNNGLPDVSALMFPSADPFAYPNQPMMEFENMKQDDMRNLDGQLFLSNTAGSSGRIDVDDLEGMLYGPVPPYMNQGQQTFDLQAPNGPESMVNEMDSDLNYQAGFVPSDENLDIFGDGGGWGNMLANQRYQ